VKQIGSLLAEVTEFTQRYMREREEKLRKSIGDKHVLTWVEETYGDAVAFLFPDDFSMNDLVTTVSDGALDNAKKRLKLCATCPPHGGACASEYESNHGKAPKWDREKGLRSEWCPRWKEHTLRRKLTSVGVGEAYLGERFSTYVPTTDAQRDAKARCEEYAAAFKRGTTRGNLILAGQNYGVGKTHLSIAVVADLLARYRLRTAMFAYVPEFLERIRRSYSSDDPEQRLVENACTTDLLVLDDLAAQRTTDWVREQMNLISNARSSNKLPTIITTNASFKELEETLGPRAASRFFGNMFGAVVDGPDRRVVEV